jgi:hypothetical protein
MPLLQWTVMGLLDDRPGVQQQHHRSDVEHQKRAIFAF